MILMMQKQKNHIATEATVQEKKKKYNMKLKRIVRMVHIHLNYEMKNQVNKTQPTAIWTVTSTDI